MIILTIVHSYNITHAVTSYSSKAFLQTSKKMSSRYNLRSRSNVPSTTRYEDETWIPGANNGHCAGRQVDMGESVDVSDFLGLQLNNQDLYVSSGEEDYDSMPSLVGSSDEEDCEEEEYTGSETEDDEDNYSVYSEDEETEEEEEPETDEQEEHTCQGCEEDQPNQMAHMEPGGCLYDESLEVDEETEIDSDEEKRPESPEVNLQFNDFPIQGAAALAAGLTTPPTMETPTSPPPVIPKPVLRRSNGVESCSLDNMTNDELIDEYWRPSFSTELSNHPNFGTLEIDGTFPISNPPYWLTDNNHPFTLLRVREDAMHLHHSCRGMIVMWDGVTYYKNGEIRLSVELFYQDIHPFIYDSWDHDEYDLTGMNFTADSLEWVVFDDDKVLECVEHAGLWEPTKTFKNNRLGYGEWENERLDVQYTGRPPREKVMESDWEDNWEEESVADSIS